MLGFEFSVRGAVMVPDSVSPVLAPNLYSANLMGGGPGGLTGNILKGSEKPYDFDPFGISITAGYRFLPYLSAGGFFDYANFQVKDGTDSGDYIDSTSQLQRQMWHLGAYVRLYGVAQNARHTSLPYLPGSIFNRLQPWIELGVGYTQDTASYVRGSAQALSGPGTVDYYLSANGVATNLRIGLDWRLAPIFSLGPVLGYGRIFPVNGCADAEPQSDANNGAGLPAANTCSAASSTNVASGPTQNSSYGIVFGGIFAKVTLGPDVY